MCFSNRWMITTFWIMEMTLCRCFHLKILKLILIIFKNTIHLQQQTILVIYTSFKKRNLHPLIPWISHPSADKVVPINKQHHFHKRNMEQLPPPHSKKHKSTTIIPNENLLHNDFLITMLQIMRMKNRHSLISR